MSGAAQTNFGRVSHFGAACIADRVAALDWPAIETGLEHADGRARDRSSVLRNARILPPLCLGVQFPQPDHHVAAWIWLRRIQIYLANPLPGIVGSLRASLSRRSHRSPAAGTRR